MLYRDVPNVYKEALCIFEAFRRFHFKAKDIYVQLAQDPTGTQCLFVQLKVEGHRPFIVRVGPCDTPKEEFPTVYAEVCDALRTAPDAELQATWRRVIAGNSVGFVTALHQHGLPLQTGPLN